MTDQIMIEALDLSKFYGPFVAVENVRFAIPKGQIVAFLGPNGAGKTTTMKMLTGYLAPSAEPPRSPASMSTKSVSRPPAGLATCRKTARSTRT